MCERAGLGRVRNAMLLVPGGVCRCSDTTAHGPHIVADRGNRPGEDWCLGNGDSAATIARPGDAGHWAVIRMSREALSAAQAAWETAEKKTRAGGFGKCLASEEIY